MRASTSQSPSPLNFLFVYGTLRTGEMRHDMLASGRILSIIPASVAGQLLDFGAYPGLVHGQNGSRVQGELIEFEAFEQISRLIDEEEGPDFTREGIECTVSNGRIYQAWVYRFIGRTAGAPVSSCGDWCAR